MMNGYQFNRIQYQFFSDLLKKDLGQVKANASCRWILDTHCFGKIVNSTWFYTEKDRAGIIELVKLQFQTNLLIDPYPDKQSRVKNAQLNNNEKVNSLSVSHDFVLVNSLQGLLINNHITDITSLNTLGVYLNTHQISSIEHKHIVLVENLSVMANLQHLIFKDNAKHIKEALWVYRGDVKPQQNTNQAYQFFRRFKASHQLICFSDFDPEGLLIAASSGAIKYLAPSADALQQLSVKGTEQDYYNQIKTVNKLSNDSDLSIQCRALLDAMGAGSDKKTIKQEHLLAHQIPLSLFELR